MNNVIDPYDPINIQEDLQHFVGKTFEGFTADQIKRSELSEDSVEYVPDSDEMYTLSVDLHFSPKKYENFTVCGLIKVLKDGELVSSLKTEEEWDNDNYKNIIGKKVQSCSVNDDLDFIFSFEDKYSLILENYYDIIEYAVINWDQNGVVLTLT